MQHTLADFDRALDGIRTRVLTMGSVARRNLTNAIKGLLERNSELCNEAIADDDEVNQLELEIDQAGMETMMRFHPVAGDLRKVIAAMRMANNLERVSDLAESIARRARKVLKQAEIEEIKLVGAVYDLAANLLDQSIRSFSDGDVALALSIHTLDKELDQAYGKVMKRLTRSMESGDARIKTLLNLMFIIRSLERIGDHAVNIGEDTVFIERAQDVRHGGREDVVLDIS